VCPRTDLNAVVKKEIPYPDQESNPGRRTCCLVTVLTEYKIASPLF